MATHCSTLAWRIPWTEEPGRLQPMGSQSWTRLRSSHFHSVIQRRKGVGLRTKKELTRTQCGSATQKEMKTSKVSVKRRREVKVTLQWA